MQVDKIRPGMDLDGVLAAYGDDAEVREIDLGEGFTARGARVFGGTDQQLDVTYDVDGTFTVTLGPAWRTDEGLGVGTSWAELQSALGGPFEIYGFGWDYAGSVVLSGTAVSDDEGVLFLQTAPTAGTPEDEQAVLGDQTFSSTNPHVQALEPKVVRARVVVSPH